MYAMCNLHDVTWWVSLIITIEGYVLTKYCRGTKGDNGSTKDLGGAKKVKDSDGKEKFEVEVPTAREDVDKLWNASRNALAMKPPQEKEHRDAATKQADHDRNSRTNVVLAWTGTNMYVDSILLRCALSWTLAAGSWSWFSPRTHSTTGSRNMSNSRKIPPSTLILLSSSTPCRFLQQPFFACSICWPFLSGRVCPLFVSSALLSTWYSDSSVTNRREYNGYICPPNCNIRFIRVHSRVCVSLGFRCFSRLDIGTANKNLLLDCTNLVLPDTPSFLFARILVCIIFEVTFSLFFVSPWSEIPILRHTSKHS